MSWLTNDEYVPYAPESIGTIHKHHCKSGKDNDKLFITRCSDGYILAYCHHCGKRGRFNALKSKTILQLKEISKLTNGLKGGSKNSRRDYIKELPRDYTTTSGEWGTGALGWVKRYGISDREIKENHIGYSEQVGRVVLPYFDADGELECYQLRRLSEYDTKPKYLTMTNVQHTLYVPHRDHHKVVFPDTVVLTEDILSSIKVARVQDSIALLGTSINDRVVEYIASKYNNVIILLDDDNNQVRTNQLKILNRLKPLVKDVVICHTDLDPKELSEDKLEKLLWLSSY